MSSVVLNIEVKNNASGALGTVAKELDKVGSASDKAKKSQELYAQALAKAGAANGGFVDAQTKLRLAFEAARQPTLDAAKAANEVAAAQKGIGDAVVKAAAQAQAGAAKTKAATAGIGAQFKALSKDAEAAGKAIGAAVAGFAAVIVGGSVALVKLASSASAYGESVQNAAARTGLATDAVQELMKFGKDSGVAFDAIATSINKMQVALVKTPKVFTALGLDPKSLAAASPDKALAQIADRINQIGNQSQKTAALQEIFGRGGAASMAPLIAALSEARKRAADLGAVLSDRQLLGLAVFDQALDDAGTAWDGLWLQLGSAVGNSPAIREAIEGITNALVALSNWVKAHEEDFSALFDAILSGALSAFGGIVMLVQHLPGGESLVEKMFGSREKIADYYKYIDDGINRIVARTRDRALGIVPVLPTKVPGGTRGGGADPAAEAAERAALDAAKAWTKAAESARAAWDKFDDDQGKRGETAFESLRNSATRQVAEGVADKGVSIKQLADRWAKEVVDGLTKAGADGAAALQQAINSIEFEWDQNAEWDAAMKDARMAALDMAAATADAFLDMAAAAQGFAEQIGGVAGAFISFGAAGVNAYGQITGAIVAAQKRQEEFGKSVGTTADKISALANAIRTVGSILSGPGGGKGAAGGALAGAGAGAAIGSVFPGIGTVAGAIGGGILGGVAGLFGGGGKKQAAADLKSYQDQILQLGGTMENLKNIAARLGVSLGNAFNTKNPADAKRVFEELNKALELEGLQKELVGLGGDMFHLQELAQKFGIDLKKAFSTKEPAELKVIVDQLNKSLEEQAKRIAGLNQASTSLSSLFSKLKPRTIKGAQAQATIFTATFWAQVKEQGFGAAIDALGGSFEDLKKSLTPPTVPKKPKGPAAGEEETDKQKKARKQYEQALKDAKDFESKFGKGLTEHLLDSVAIFFDPKIKDVVTVFDNIKSALEGIADAGYLTQGAFDAFGTTATEGFQQALDAGLSIPDALRVIAPLLGSIISASEQYGFVIDDNTQKLIDQAKNAGVAFPVDPIVRAATAMERVATALEKALGISNDLGDSLGDLPRRIPNFPNPNDQGKYDGSDVRQQGAFHGFGNPIHAAEGWGPKVVPNLGSGLGPMFQTHAGELVMIVPKKDVSKNKGLIYGDFGKKDKKGKGLGEMYGKVIQAAEGFGRRDDPREPREPRDPRVPQAPPPSSPGTSAPPAATPVKVVQAIHQNQRKQDEKFDRVLAVLEKVAKNADKQQPVTVAVTQQSTFNLDASQVASNKQAFLQEVGAHLAQDMKAGGSALGRAVQGQIEKTVGRGRAKAS